MSMRRATHAETHSEASRFHQRGESLPLIEVEGNLARNYARAMRPILAAHEPPPTLQTKFCGKRENLNLPRPWPDVIPNPRVARVRNLAHLTSHTKRKRPHSFLNVAFIYAGNDLRSHTLGACSTIGPAGLNFRVRDGNGWIPRGKITDNS